MKKTSLFIILLIITFVPAVKAQFEGEMALKTTRKMQDKPMEALVNVLIKNDMLTLRVKDDRDLGKDVTIIYRGDKKALWIVNDKEKSYIEMPMKEHDDGEMPEPGRSDRRGKKSPVNVRKTGKTETILGYPCEEYIIEQGDEEKDVWGTTKLGDVYDGFMKAFGQIARQRPGRGMEGWQSELMKLKIFPLKSVTKTKGDVTSSEEITKVEKKTLAASLFEAPDGYKKQSLDFDMDNMMKGMREKMKGGAGKGMDMDKLMEQMKEKMKKRQDKNEAGEDSSKENNE